MSSTAQVALLAPHARLEGGRGRPRRRERDAVLVRLGAFSALGLYGALRWATLLSGSEARVRLLALLATAVLVAGAGVWLAPRRRLLIVPLVVIAFLGGLPLAGIPLEWLDHARVAVTLRAIGVGIGTLPRVLVPYLGFDPWVRVVIVAGGGLLLLDAAVMLALSFRSGSELRRAAPALPLLALVAIPTTLVHPKFAYLEGLLVFGLLAGLLWGDRVRAAEFPAAVALCGLAAAVGMTLAPALDHHRAWVNPQALTGGLTLPPERFDWRQGYGPINWPRDGETVFEVQARQSDYWKTEDLDVFDGRGWEQGTLLTPGDPYAGVAQSTVRRWTQTVSVTLRSIDSREVIAAGTAAPPVGLPSEPLAGPSQGTWLSGSSLQSGDSYQVAVYDPQPTTTQLADAGIDYPPELLPGYLTLLVPAAAPGSGGPPEPASQQVVVPPFGSPPGSAYGPTSVDPVTTLKRSPYAGAYELAQRLVAASPTPYAYLQAVMTHLARGFTYSETPPPSRYPLISFLFSSHAGYCQQFAGAMALLLRLGGIPARVAVGFTPGSYDATTHRWLVTDIDAHAWVEAFFPHYGWVRFDPTPPADPALGGHPGGLVGGAGGSSALPLKSGLHGLAGGGSPATAGRPGTRIGGSGPAPALLAALGLLAVATLTGLVLWVRPLADPEAYVQELERAFTRTGRPLPVSATLAGVEHRLRTAPAAADYVRALRLARYGTGAGGPTESQRRALRRALRSGLGVTGRLRAVWALPPRRGSRRAGLH